MPPRRSFNSAEAAQGLPSRHGEVVESPQSPRIAGTGRGYPWLRGLITGLMTTAGGIGHTLPFLIPSFRTATAVAIVVVAVELAVISYVRHRYMDTPFLAAAFQVVVGGVLVFATGILIGSS